jgi:hypothetical protein
VPAATIRLRYPGCSCGWRGAASRRAFSAVHATASSKANWASLVTRRGAMVASVQLRGKKVHAHVCWGAPGRRRNDVKCTKIEWHSESEPGARKQYTHRIYLLITNCITLCVLGQNKHSPCLRKNIGCENLRNSLRKSLFRIRCGLGIWKSMNSLLAQTWICLLTYVLTLTVWKIWPATSHQTLLGCGLMKRIGVVLSLSRLSSVVCHQTYTLPS